MSRPVVPDSLKNKFSITRKTQMNNSNPLDDFNHIQIDPDVENMINDGVNDTQSMISDDSRESKNSRASKRRKAIRINT